MSLVLSIVLAAAPTVPPPACARDNAGLKLPAGFCAILVRDSVPFVRHLVVAPNGDVIAANLKRGLFLYRDTDGDGRADEVHQLVTGVGGSGVALSSTAIYFATDDSVLRIPFKVGGVAPTGPIVTIARGLPGGGHSSKGLALGKDGSLFVSFGSFTNSCQKKGEDRTGPYPAPNPCVELQ